MSNLGINGADPNEPVKFLKDEDTIGSESAEGAKKEALPSIWTKYDDGDGVFTVDEQIAAVRGELANNEGLKAAIADGFELEPVLDSLKGKCSDINTKSMCAQNPDTTISFMLQWVLSSVVEFTHNSMMSKIDSFVNKNNFKAPLDNFQKPPAPDNFQDSPETK